MHIVAFNGESGTGKSTMARELGARLTSRESSRQFQHEHFIRPIQKLLFALFKYGEDRLDDLELYTELKKRNVGAGMTGRDAMVAAGRIVRESNPSFFGDAMFERLVNIADNRIIIIDDLGHMNELEALTMVVSARRRMKDDHSRLTVVYLDERASRKWADGERFPDDRVSLRQYATLTNPSMEELLIRVCR